ncbi:MAG TPA: ELM1/GtrOC1 family putative glycosyltransferase [bacterium]
MLDWLACSIVKISGAALCRMPPGAAVRIGAWLGTLGYCLQPKRRRIGVANVLAAFDGRVTIDRARAIVRSSFRELGSGMLELLRLPVIDRAYIDRYVRIEGLEHYERALASGRPVILLTGHFGNWELTSIASAVIGHPIVALAREQRALPGLYRLLVSYRESKGTRIIHKGGAMKRLIAALDAAQPVGIVGDQASRRGVWVDFFGRPALFSTGPYVLAHRRGAQIIPGFIHRVGGPRHRIVIGPPFDLSASGKEADAVQAGAERFAGSLRRHIEEDPGQWLWMHKRWKHTTARRVLVISDGKAGHAKQSRALVEALAEARPGVSARTVVIRFRSRAARVWCTLWSLLAPGGWGADGCLRLTLTAESSRVLRASYADLVLSCGSTTAPVALLWRAVLGAKAAAIMTPAPVPPRRFDLVIAPRHDVHAGARNVVRIDGAISRLGEETLTRARERLASHPGFRRPAARAHEGPMIALLVGGNTPEHELSAAFAESLAGHVLGICEELGGGCLVTTSRRTPPPAERALEARLRRHPACRLLVLASRDPLEQTMEGILGMADLVIVTGESISMVSEACASGRRVLVVEPPRRDGRTGGAAKSRRFLSTLEAEGYLAVHPVPELAHAARRALRDARPVKPLDNLTPARDALARLL